MTDLELSAAAVAHLARLPPDLADALRVAIATTRRGDRSAWELEREHWRVALEAAGFTRASGQLVQREIPLATTLTETQRLVAEFLAFVPGMPLSRWPLYASTWLAQRWLGLAPGGVLFDDVEVEIDGAPQRWPLLQALRLRLREGPTRASALLEALPWSTRVAALALVHTVPEDVYAGPLSPLVEATIKGSLTPPGPVDAALILAVADEICARYDQPFVAGERTRGEPGELLSLLLLGTLVGAGALTARHERLLRLGFGIFAPVTRSAIAAIPPERRDAALVAALGEKLFDSDRVRIGALFLDEHPLPGFIAAIVAAAERSDAPPKALATLQPIGARHPAVAATVAAAVARLGALPTWQPGPRLDPIPHDGAGLDAVRRRQLEIVEHRYSGRVSSAEAILARGEGHDVDESILPAHTAWLVLLDAQGTPAFDAWLTMGDSGAIFTVGTERVVAEIVQGGVESADRTLRLSLPSVLGFKPPRAVVTKKTSTKTAKTATAKTATAKTATKKTATKTAKTATKKTATKTSKTATKKT